MCGQQKGLLCATAAVFESKAYRSEVSRPVAHQFYLVKKKRRVEKGGFLPCKGNPGCTCGWLCPSTPVKRERFQVEQWLTLKPLSLEASGKRKELMQQITQHKIQVVVWMAAAGQSGVLMAEQAKVTLAIQQEHES